MINEKSFESKLLYDIYSAGKKVFELLENSSEDFTRVEASVLELNLLIIKCDNERNLTDDQKLLLQTLKKKKKNSDFMGENLKKLFFWRWM